MSIIRLKKPSISHETRMAWEEQAVVAVANGVIAAHEGAHIDEIYHVIIAVVIAYSEYLGKYDDPSDMHPMLIKELRRLDRSINENYLVNKSFYEKLMSVKLRSSDYEPHNFDYSHLIAIGLNINA